MQTGVGMLSVCMEDQTYAIECPPVPLSITTSYYCRDLGIIDLGCTFLVARHPGVKVLP